MKSLPVILAIIGPSGSGKTSLSLFLQKALGIPSLCSFTTRPMREGETEGVDHYFTSNSKKPPEEELLAQTTFGGYQYWTTHKQAQGSPICTYVVDEVGLNELNKKWNGVYDVCAIHIQRPINDTDQQRKDRDKFRTACDFSVGRHVFMLNNTSIENLFVKAVKFIKKQFPSQTKACISKLSHAIAT